MMSLSLYQDTPLDISFDSAVGVGEQLPLIFWTDTVSEMDHHLSWVYICPIWL